VEVQGIVAPSAPSTTKMSPVLAALSHGPPPLALHWLPGALRLNHQVHRPLVRASTIGSPSAASSTGASPWTTTSSRSSARPPPQRRLPRLHAPHRPPRWLRQPTDRPLISITHRPAADASASPISMSSRPHLHLKSIPHAALSLYPPPPHHLVDKRRRIWPVLPPAAVGSKLPYFLWWATSPSRGWPLDEAG
jgi:hypothetical protein